MWSWLANHGVSLGWLLFLAACAAFFFRSWVRLNKMKHWPVTPGEIMTLTVCEKNNRKWPSIQYRYWVEEREYTSRYWFADTIHNSPCSAYSRKLAYRAAISFKQGCPLDVHYNPVKPEQAVLDVTIPLKLKGIIVLVCSLFMVEALMLFFHG